MKKAASSADSLIHSNFEDVHHPTRIRGSSGS